MPNRENLKPSLIQSLSPDEFVKKSLEVFQFQHAHVPVYRSYCDHLKVKVKNVTALEDIPFLPIELFKSHEVSVEKVPFEKVFFSSGTTGQNLSQHFVADLDLYQQSFMTGFTQAFGPPASYVIMGLLPNYMEQGGSSLVYMVDKLIEASQHPESGFHLNNLDELADKIRRLDAQGTKIILFGVSYALLDLMEKGPWSLANTILIETGGMKGRRKEMIKSDLHQILKTGFGLPVVHSEYGMTELLSQAYAHKDGRFHCPPWMKVLTRDTEDPFSYVQNKTGGVNVIDLANLNSCAFIATQDLAILQQDGSFELLGRFDNSDLRGCNLMIS
ncbi:MAG: acyl transferase [Flavobacteriaceae bacterium]|nr:acyl transferase [Flavobacteriaceae bacterium]MDG1962865.1 acyl transferase [Flavobacteriaceae bacterium]